MRLPILRRGLAPISYPPHLETPVRSRFVGSSPFTVLALMLTACATTTHPASQPSQKHPSGLHLVVYRAEGATTRGRVSYWTPSGIGTEKNATLPWEKSLEMKADTSVSVSVQNAGTGTVRCSITVDGKLVKQSTGTGKSAIATCDGRLDS